MARELFERLVTVFDCTEADARVALCFGWMQLTQCNHGLAIALFVESDGCPEPPRIVIAVRSVIELDQSRSFDTTEYHPVGEALAIRCDHVEAPQTADAYVDLLGLDFKTGWSEPIRQMFRVGPGRKHDVAPRIYYPRENDFAIERPLRKRDVGGRGHDQSFDWHWHVTVVSMTLSNSRRSWPQRGAPRRLRNSIISTFASGTSSQLSSHRPRADPGAPPKPHDARPANVQHRSWRPASTGRCERAHSSEIQRGRRPPAPGRASSD